MCTDTVSGRGTTPVDASARGGDFQLATTGDFQMAIRGDLELATHGDFFMATDTHCFPTASHLLTGVERTAVHGVSVESDATLSANPSIVTRRGPPHIHAGGEEA